MVHISLSPNIEKDDVAEALKIFSSPFAWNKGSCSERLKNSFAAYFNTEKVWLFNSGRSALYVLLRAMKIGDDDEVILQSFTCNAVANPIVWAGAKPVYADIDKSFNILPEDIEKKITDNTKAIIVQHTFGIPAQMEKILSIAHAHGVPVIEDCAHALGAEYVPADSENKSKKVGTMGDAAFFSFGRDKVISSVYGGAVIANKSEIQNELDDEFAKLSYPAMLWTIQQVLHPILSPFILATYNFLGKYLLFALQKLRLLSVAVSKQEKSAEKPSYFPAKMPNALSCLALNQFHKLDKLNSHRKKLARIYEDALKDKKGFKIPEYYSKGSIFLRYPVMHKNPEKIKELAKEKGFILGDWYKEVIAPEGTEKQAVNYKGNTENAERSASEILNLPTNIRTKEKDAGRLVKLLLSNF